ncbi:uncharacterized protein METZ01_LOCUS418373 [marine metagenome]|uniref:Uncharacterized protein n=1 Tax=marine metagenome TaxID=408172 RepID=A0A382X3U4_9ZZZZ
MKQELLCEIERMKGFWIGNQDRL